MSEMEPTDELLNTTFQLAYFILGDRTAAVYLATAAMDRLKIASTVQNRRLYYVPIGRSPNPAARTKVSLSRLHLLQRLVYTESELFERLTEGRGGPLAQQDMVVRFVKHLVMVTTRRNSFYVTLGLCRLLYNYTTAETADIYNLLIQDPDRGRDDYYYRSRKRHLLHELKQRFGESLRTYRTGREERFQPHEEQGAYAGLVHECLSRFTPWQSPCVLPADIDPRKDLALPLQFNGERPDEEHEIELNRIHTLLHPPCLERLVATLGLDAPSRRLEVPRFFITGGGCGLPNDRLNPQPLGEGELEAMRHYLARNAALRRDVSRRAFVVLVDRKERARFEVARSGGVQVVAAVGSEWLEVRGVGAEGDVPIALHQLARPEGLSVGSRPFVARGAGHELFFKETRAAGDADVRAGDFSVSVSYAETSVFALASASARRFGALLVGWAAPVLPRGGDFPKYAFGSLLVTLCAAGLIFYLQTGRTPPAMPRPAEQAQVTPRAGTGAGSGVAPLAPTEQPTTTEPPTDRSAPASTVGAGRRGLGGRKQGTRQGGAPTRPPAYDSEAEVGTNRGRAAPPAAALSAVTRVYVDPLGGGPSGEPVRSALVKALQSSGRFEVVEQRAEADAVFKGSVSVAPGGKQELVVNLRLVNFRGEVIWTTSSRRAASVSTGDPSSAAHRLVETLLAELEGQKPRK